MRKPGFCICKNKSADQLRSNQLRSNCAADQRLCFCFIVQSLYFRNYKHLAVFCGFTERFVLDLVRNPEDRFLAHLSQRLIGELIVYRSSRRLCVRPSVRALTLSNMNISATSWPMGMKFYLKRLWGGGKASVGFDPDQIRTLVSMATDSSHRLIMGKTASSRFLKFF